MKKFLSILFMLLPLISSAQSFVLTPDGFRNADDQETSIIVIEVQGTQAALYNKAKTAVTMIWKSAKDVMSYNEPDVIIVTGFDSGSIWKKTMGMTFVYDFNYRFQFQFKDGKIRIDAPSIDQAVNKKSTLYFGKGKGSTMSGTMYIFNEKGELKQKDFKAQAENFVNGIVSTFVDKVKNGLSDEDW